MEVFGNIECVTSIPTLWKLYTNKSYPVKIQIADSQRIYNVPDNPGIVYNYLENAYEKVDNANYVITGMLGEMWPISKNSLMKYSINPEYITLEPISVNTMELSTVYAAIIIPSHLRFALEINYGEKSVLHGNRLGIEHGVGDYILVKTKLENGLHRPDFTDSGRIINGTIFHMLYKPFYENQDSF